MAAARGSVNVSRALIAARRAFWSRPSKLETKRHGELEADHGDEQERDERPPQPWLEARGDIGDHRRGSWQASRRRGPEAR